VTLRECTSSLKKGFAENPDPRSLSYGRADSSLIRLYRSLRVVSLVRGTVKTLLTDLQVYHRDTPVCCLPTPPSSANATKVSFQLVVAWTQRAGRKPVPNSFLLE